MQRLIDAGLVGAERAATLQHQNDLTGVGFSRQRLIRRRTVVLHVHVTLHSDHVDSQIFASRLNLLPSRFSGGHLASSAGYSWQIRAWMFFSAEICPRRGL